MTAGESLSRVLIFDDYHNDTFRKIATESAEQAGWDALSFKNPHDALGHFDERVGALVTALGIMEFSPRSGCWRFPGQLLIDLSDAHGTPRAVLSSHPGADKFIRHGTSDLVIPKDVKKPVQNMLSKFLMSL